MKNSFTMWMKSFILLYTDTFRDFISFMAEDEDRNLLDYIFISELSEMYKEEGGMIMKDWIELKNLSEISQGIGKNWKDVINFINAMGGIKEWIDPFSHDNYFNK